MEEAHLDGTQVEKSRVVSVARGLVLQGFG